MWYSRVVASLNSIPDFIQHYEQELEEARREVAVYGNIEKNLAGLPGITERRFNQLQEVEAVLNYLNIKLRKIRRTHFQKYLENYQRALTSRDVEKYVEMKNPPRGGTKRFVRRGTAIGRRGGRRGTAIGRRGTAIGRRSRGRGRGRRTTRRRLHA